MNDYMRALRQRFDSPLETDCEIEKVRENLRCRLEKQGRKLLLRLMDLEDELRDEASLHSFISGFRLACGVHAELMEFPAYSFDREEEERAKEIYIREQEET